LLKELLTRSAWLTLGSALGRLLPLGVLVWTSRHFEPSQFASASAGFAWAGVAMSLTSTAEATVMTQRLGRQVDAMMRRGLYVRHASRALWLSVALALVVCVAGPLGTRALFGDTISVGVIVPAALSGVLWSQVAIGVAALNGSHLARRASATLAMCGLLQGTSMLLALTYFRSAEAMVWGLAAGSSLALVLAQWQVQTAFGPVLRDRKVTAAAVRTALGHIRLGVNPVLWTTLATVSVMPATFFASSMISRGDDGTRQLAQYFALEQVHQVLVYVPAMLGQALLPLVSRKLGGFDDGRDHGLFLRRMAWVAAVAAMAGAALALLIGWFPQWLLLLLGNRSLDMQAAPAIRAMLVNASLALSLSLLGGAFVGSGRIVVAALLNLLWGCLVLTFTSTWSAQGNYGLQLARVLASTSVIVLACLLLLHYTRRSSRLTHTP